METTINIKKINKSGFEVKKHEKNQFIYCGESWRICGGANLVQQLVNEDLIDCYYITIKPTLLGSGIRLFENVKNEIKLRLLNLH